MTMARTEGGSGNTNRWYQRILNNKAPTYNLGGYRAPTSTNWQTRAVQQARNAANQLQSQLPQRQNNRDRQNAAWSGRLNAEWLAYQQKANKKPLMTSNQFMSAVTQNNAAEQARRDRINQAWSDRLYAQLQYYQSYVPPTNDTWNGGSDGGGLGGGGGGGGNAYTPALPEWYLQGVQWKI